MLSFSSYEAVFSGHLRFFRLHSLFLEYHVMHVVMLDDAAAPNRREMQHCHEYTPLMTRHFLHAGNIDCQ